MDLNLSDTGAKVLYYWNDPKKKIIVLEGGSGAGKTWGIIQNLILYCLQNTGKRIVMMRETSVGFKKTALKDFKKIFKELGLWDDNKHRAGEQEYILNGNEIAYGGLDNATLHGGRQDVAWINEAIDEGINFETFYNFLRYTNDKILLDYNPRRLHSWIYTEIIPRKDCAFINVTQKNNELLPEVQREELLRTKDPTLRKIYLEGKRAQPVGLVFPNITIVDEYPLDPKREVYGQDYGFVNDPSTLYRICFNEGELWIDELLYEYNLPVVSAGRSLSQSMEDLGISKWSEIIADSAEQGAIQALQNEGWNVIPAQKGAGSVRIGIDAINRYKINITKRSINLLKEQQNYIWKRKPDSLLMGINDFLNEPVKGWDHGWDSVRYAVLYMDSRKPAPVYRPQTIKIA